MAVTKWWSVKEIQWDVNIVPCWRQPRDLYSFVLCVQFLVVSSIELIPKSNFSTQLTLHVNQQ